MPNKNIFTAVLVIILISISYLLPGMIGHDPWKQDEAYTFGMINHILKTGEWLVPTNAGNPFMEKPPLYIWLAAISTKIFSPWMALHDAARLINIFLVSITFIFAALTAKRFFKCQTLFDAPVLAVISLMASTFIVIKHVHDLFTDVALLMGTTIALMGIINIVKALEQNKIRTPNLLDIAFLGLGVGIAFMSKGVFIPLVFFLTIIVLPIIYNYCQSRSYLVALVLAFIWFLPFALIWPILLFKYSPFLFMEWFWDNNIGRFIGFSVEKLGAENEPFFILQSFLTSSFPISILALIGLILGSWKKWCDPFIAISIIFPVIGLSILSLSATARQLYLLPFALPLSLLAADAIIKLPEKFAFYWDYVSRIMFIIAAIFIGYIWIMILQPIDKHASLHFLARWLPIDYVLPFQLFKLIAAICLFLGYLFLLKIIPQYAKWRGALSWFLGITLTWGLIFILLLPWLNQAKSYEPVFTDLSKNINALWGSDDCLASIGLGESEAPMLEYFGGIVHKPISGGIQTHCRWLIVQSSQSNIKHLGSNWRKIWFGARQGDHNELLTVYLKKH